MHQGDTPSERDPKRAFSSCSTYVVLLTDGEQVYKREVVARDGCTAVRIAAVLYTDDTMSILGAAEAGINIHDTVHWP